jgi:Mrp family chromosome partitioning ATPase
VAGPNYGRAAELLATSRFRDFLREVSEVYDAVIVDSPPLLSVADTLEMLPYVDGVLMCVRVNQTTRDQAMAAKAALGHLPDRPTALVVTGVRPDGDTYGYYSNTYVGDA